MSASLSIPPVFNSDTLTVVNVGGRTCHLYVLVAFCQCFSIDDWVVPKGLSFVCSSKNNVAQWYYVFPNPNVCDAYLEEHLADPSLLKKIEEYMHTVREETVAKIKRDNYSNLSFAETLRLLEEFRDGFKRICRGGTPMRVLDIALMQYLQNQPNSAELIQSFSVARRPVFIFEEEMALLNIAVRAKKGEPVEAALQTILDEFAWSVSGYYHEKPRTLMEYRRMVEEMTDPESVKAKAEENRQKDLAMLQETLAKSDGRTRAIGEVASEAIYAKDLFKYCINKLIFFAEPLFERLAELSGESTDFIKSLLSEEWEQLAEGKKIDPEMIASRRQWSVYFSTPEPPQFGLLTGIEADEFDQKYLRPDLGEAKEFKGRTACRGKVTGKVRLVVNGNDFPKVEAGDIIVVINTSPDYVSILKKVSGIIAEEGGITAHVSVVSRELGIPCVVGIRRATEIFKDGDSVELDADSGIVRML